MKSISIKDKRIINLVQTWWTKIVYLAILICLFYLVQFLYQNLYQTIIIAKNVSYEQISKQQTVNIALWNKIRTRAENKKQIELDTSSLKNPFQ